MKKSQLIVALAEQQNLPMRDAKSIVETILGAMTEALIRGEKIELRGFGTFKVRKYESYTGRNPKTGEKIKTSPKKLPFFKVGKELREEVNTNCRN
ncbi:MAG: integration host factor subunit beta [Desulfobulbus sp.]|nr:integration host factor subunit beta [Desulfobulbus sp.]